jgi:hypothetical protein
MTTYFMVFGMAMHYILGIVAIGGIARLMLK